MPGEAKESASYRLAGVVAVGKDYLGFLELPDGGQVLVRKGSAISGGGHVVALDRERLRIAFPDRTIELSLQGSGTPSVPAASQGVLQGQVDREHVMVRDVDNGVLREALATQGTPASARPNQGSQKHVDPATEVGRRFASVVNIPLNSRVVAVNEVPVTSADATMALVDRSLAEGIALRLNLAGTGSGDLETRVYLSPVMR
jgi:hypothetical protein